MYFCSECGASFTRIDNLRRHERSSCKGSQSIHNVSTKRRKVDEEPSTSTSSTSMQICNCCNKNVAAHKMASHMRTLEHKTNSCITLSNGIQMLCSAFKCRIVSYRIHSESRHLDYVTFFSEIKNKVLSLLEEVLRIHKAVKVNMEVFGRYILQTQECSDIKSFNTTNTILDLSSDLASAYDIFIDKMITQSTEFQERDSGILFPVCNNIIVKDKLLF